MGSIATHEKWGMVKGANEKEGESESESEKAVEKSYSTD